IVSAGELYVANAAGFPMQNAFFHGSNKTDAMISMAMDMGLGWFIVDNREELDEINRQAAERGICQNILLRLSPGIDPHTHAKISTGKVDSKFGTAIETGQAEELIRYTLTLANVKLNGFHCHIGSQIFEIEPFCDAADIMLAFMAHIEKTCGVRLPILNLGGGFGVRYVEDDPVIDYEKNIAEIASHLRAKSAECGIEMPDILMEPGRSIVADAGMTLYTVGSVKTITGYKSYVSIDGGMTDNPRYALYGSKYTVLNADHADREKDFVCTIAGCCCESGDLIQEDVAIAKPVRGEHIAVCVTGAYNYAMSSNYNKVPRPPIVMLRDGRSRIAVRRETFADLVAYDAE
ncbi:MAG: diaminopimelate decarboxylase, partial [Clostridia bacterium]|nr:diaminopimelate decarboxylase [Clostridia bacterium]